MLIIQWSLITSALQCGHSDGSIQTASLLSVQDSERCLPVHLSHLLSPWWRSEHLALSVHGLGWLWSCLPGLPLWLCPPWLVNLLQRYWPDVRQYFTVNHSGSRCEQLMQSFQLMFSLPPTCCWVPSSCVTKATCCWPTRSELSTGTCSEPESSASTTAAE